MEHSSLDSHGALLLVNKTLTCKCPLTLIGTWTSLVGPPTLLLVQQSPQALCLVDKEKGPSPRKVISLPDKDIIVRLNVGSSKGMVSYLF
jgi:hypothetical protein